jgi:hypothetical protein
MTKVNDQYLKHIEVNNPELLAILDEYAKLHTWKGFKQNVYCTAEEHARQRPFYVGENYMNQIISEGKGHDGFPEHLLGYNLKLADKHHQMFFADADPIFRRDLTNHLADLNDRMMSFLSTKHNALTAVYPPEGFISWHNNQNAPGFNLIFSYSESGSGWFDYVHPETGERIRCQDEPGKWTCKAAYFGSFDEPDKRLYHAASANGDWRTTVSYIFDMSEESASFREMVLEDIQSEY